MECPFLRRGDNMSTRNCVNNCNVTLGHNMFLDIYKLSTRIGYGGSPCGRPMNAPTGLWYS